MTIDATVHTRSGTLLATLTDIVNERWTEQRNELGEGAVTVALDNADLGDLDFGNFVRVRDNGNVRYAFEIRSQDTNRQQGAEAAGLLRTVLGPGPGIVLGTVDVGGAVVYPESGIDGILGGTRFFGWMSCSCFDHVTRFNESPAMAHRQSDPDPPWTTNQPEGWPAPGTYRLWFDTPSVTSGGVNEVQSLALGNMINSGTFTITFRGQTTSAISSPWSAASVQSAMEALSTIGTGNVTVTGSGTNASPYIITFVNALGSENVPLISCNHSSLVHTPNEENIQEVTRGVKGTYANDPGCFYGYESFTTASNGSYVLFVNMKEYGEIWIDGVQVYEQTDSAAAKSTQSIPVDLPAGSHCIVFRVCKTGTNGNGWVMATLATATENEDGGFDIGTVVVKTSPNWNTLMTTVAADPPGVTVGAIMECLMTEAQALSIPDLANVTWTFDDVLDSDGVAFNEEIVFGISYGTGLLDVLQQLIDLSDGYSWRMNEDLSLDIWVNKGTDRTATVVFNEPPAYEEVHSAYAGEAARATTLLVETQDGLTEASDGAGVAAYGSRRMGVTLGTAPTFEGLADFVIRTFDEYADSTVVLTLGTHGPTGLVPHLNFDIGDWITAPGIDGTAQEWRVLSIQAQMDEDANAFWTVILLREDAP